MRDHRPGHDPTELVPLAPEILRRLELGDARRRARGYVAKGTTPKADADRKARRKRAQISRRRNR